MLLSAEALALIGLDHKPQVRAALRALMVQRHDSAELFDTAFDLFWRDPTAAQQAAALAMIDGSTPPASSRPVAGSRRIAEAMASPRKPRPREEQPPELDATFTVSEREHLQSMDFEQMSAAQIERAKAEIARLALPLDRRRTRRFRPDPGGARIDLAATLRTSLRRGG